MKSQYTTNGINWYLHNIPPKHQKIYMEASLNLQEALRSLSKIDLILDTKQKQMCTISKRKKHPCILSNYNVKHLKTDSI